MESKALWFGNDAEILTSHFSSTITHPMAWGLGLQMTGALTEVPSEKILLGTYISVTGVWTLAYPQSAKQCHYEYLRAAACRF